MLTLQEIIRRLEDYWAHQGCVIAYPYNSEVGAGTFNPHTFLRVLGPQPWRVAYVEPSRRPRDGRYAQNPFRVQQFWQFQVILKPAPDDIQDRYLASLTDLGIDCRTHDVRFVEDDWESPTLGAWGLGWQVELDGIEITQFTYFQQMGSVPLPAIPVELTYGLERIAMFSQNRNSIFDVLWSADRTWGDIFKENEAEFSTFNFEQADVAFNRHVFDRCEADARRLLELGLVFPAYDCVIKCSHAFNLLEARHAISVSERTNYIARVRALARAVAIAYGKRHAQEPAD